MDEIEYYRFQAEEAERRAVRSPEADVRAAYALLAQGWRKLETHARSRQPPPA